MLAQAFPDFGADDKLRHYAQQGLIQGGKIFRAMSGVIGWSVAPGDAVAKPSALFFLAMAAGVVGGLSMLIIPKLRNLKTFVYWCVLVTFCIIGPHNSKMFFWPLDNPNGSTPQYIPVFAPQLFVIDLTSRLHYALYEAFYDGTGLRDFTAGANGVRDFASLPTFHFNNRPGLIQEIAIFEKVCGPKSLLTLAPFPGIDGATGNLENFAALTGSMNATGISGVPNLTLPISNATDTLPALNYGFVNTHLKDNTLNNKTFTLGQIHELVLQTLQFNTHNSALYAPLGIAYEEASDILPDASQDDVRDVFTQLGVNPAVISQLEKSYTAAGESDGEDFIESKTSDFNYVWARRSSITDGFVPPASPVGDITSNAPWFILQGYFAPTGVYPGFDVNIITNDDAAGLRLDILKDADKMRPTAEQLVEMAKPNNRAMPMALGFIRHNLVFAPPPFGASVWEGLYSSENQTHLPPGGAIADPPTNAEATNGDETYHENPTFSVYDNCAQFHFDLRKRMVQDLLWKTFNGSGGAGVPTEQGILSRLNNPVNNPYNSAVFFDDAPSGKDRFPVDIPAASVDKEIEATAVKSTREFANVTIAGLTTGWTATSVGPPGANFSAWPGNQANMAEYARLITLQTMLRAAISRSAAEIARVPIKSEGVSALQITKDNIRNQMTAEFLDKQINTVGSNTMVSKFVNYVADLGVIVDSLFEGGKVFTYISFLQLMVGLSLLFVLIMTPLLFMMGILVPSYAPGVLVLTIGATLILKVIPITFTLVNVVVSMVNNLVRNGIVGTFSAVDEALLVYAIATGYTSIVAITMFILFKSGDSGMLSQIGALDGAANKIADSAMSASKAIAGAAVTIGTAGAAGAIGGAVGGKGVIGSAKGAIAGGLKQGGEVLMNSSSNIPIVGQVMKEANPARAAREGHAHSRAAEAAGGYREFAKNERAARYAEADARYAGDQTSGREQRDLWASGDADAKAQTSIMKGHQAAVETSAQIRTAKEVNAKAGEVFTEEVIANKAAAQTGALEDQAKTAGLVSEQQVKQAQSHSAMQGVKTTQEAAGINDGLSDENYAAGTEKAVAEGIEKGLKDTRIEAELKLSGADFAQMAKDGVTEEIRGVKSQHEKSEAITDGVEKENARRESSMLEKGPMRPEDMQAGMLTREEQMMAGAKGDARFDAAKTLSQEEWDPNMDDAAKAHKHRRRSSEASISATAAVYDKMSDEAWELTSSGREKKTMDQGMAELAKGAGLSSQHKQNGFTQLETAPGQRSDVGIDNAYAEMNSSMLKTANDLSEGDEQKKNELEREMGASYSEFIMAAGKKSNFEKMPQIHDSQMNNGKGGMRTMKLEDMMKKKSFGKGGLAATVHPERMREFAKVNGLKFGDTLDKMDAVDEEIGKKSRLFQSEDDSIKSKDTGWAILEAYDVSNADNASNPNKDWAQGTEHSERKFDERVKEIKDREKEAD